MYAVRTSFFSWSSAGQRIPCFWNSFWFASAPEVEFRNIAAQAGLRQSFPNGGTVSKQFILETTAASYGFSVDALCGPSRTRPLVTARQVAMYLTRELTDYSYPAIGRVFGKRDHTTVIHAVDKIAGQMQERRQIYEQVTELIQKIRAGSA